MKSKHLLLTLLMALVVPWAAQAQETVTVYDGTVTNQYVPAYIYYFDDFTRSQFVIPAGDLAEMDGGTLSSMKFYTTSSNVPYTTVSTVDVYLMEVDYTTITALEPKANGIIVYQGTLDVVSANGGGELTIEFASGYTYNGGNLLVGIENTTDAGWKGIYFYGQTVTGASVAGYNSSSLDGVTGSQRNFIPKTTFTYEPASTGCDGLETLTLNGDPEAHNATLAWTGGSGTYNIEYKKTTDSEWTLRMANYAGYGIMLVELDAETAYQARVQSVCDGDLLSNWKTVSFTTPEVCPAPTGLTVTLTPGDGTIADLSWTENGEATEWQICVDGDETNLITATTNPYQLTGLTAETAHTAKVRAYCNATDQSAWSNEVTFTPTNAYSITVNDGTSTNQYVPFYGYYGDNDANSQFIIPATDLGAMQWGTINAITFYGSNASATWTGAVFDIYFSEVNNTVFESAALVDWSELDSKVYTGSVSVVDNKMELTLTAPYQYMGGNLLIGFDETSNSSNYPSMPWYGVTQTTNTAVYKYSSNAAVLAQFLPKVTFSYTPGEEPDCLKPTGLAVNYTGGLTAEVSWTSNAEAWQICLNGDEENLIDASTNPYTLTGLELATTYNVKVRAFCNDRIYSDWTNPFSFTTDLCMPENQCEISYVLGSTSSYYSGWSYGASISVVDTETNTTIATLNTVGSGTVSVCDGRDIQFVWNSASSSYYNSYCTYTVSDVNGEEIFSGSGAMSTPVNYTVSCTITNCKKPTNVAASQVGPRSAVLSWTENGEATAWVVAYKEATATDFTEVNASTNPFTLEGLTPETAYTVKVKPECDVEKWSDETGFTTLEACPAPTGFAASNITAHTADLAWTGFSESYTVQYRTAAGISDDLVLSEGFEDETSFANWTTISNNEANTTNGRYGRQASAARTGSYGFAFSSYSNASDYNQYLISPELTETGILQFYYKHYSSAEVFKVGYSTTTNDLDAFTWGDEITSTSSWQEYTQVLPTDVKYVAINYYSNYQYELYVDDIVIAAPIAAGAWQTVTTDEATASLSGLLAETKYEATVQGDCGTDGTSAVASTTFTTDIACPAPTGLSYANVKSTSVDLSWTTGGAEDWIVAYMKDGDTEFTEEQVSTAQVTISGTTVTYTLTALLEETAYTVKVRDNCEASVAGDGQSAWTAVVSFTTMAACSVDNVVVSDMTHYTATVGWDGESASGFTVKYRTAAGINASLSEGFENGMGSWSLVNCHNSTGINSSANHSGTNGFRFYYRSNPPQYLITPELNGITEGTKLEFYYKNSSTSYEETFMIGTATSAASTAEEIEANFTFGDEISVQDGQWHLYSATIPAGTTYICFKLTSDDAYFLYIDDIVVGNEVDAGEWQTVSATASPANIEGLEAGTKYDLTVAPNCDETLASAIQQFTTLADNVKIFVTDGEWEEAGNWMDGLTPTLNDNAQLQANATITGLATAGNVTIASGKTLTIADGGQLQHNNSSTITATVKKNVTGYSADNANTNNGYVLLAPPFGKYIYQNNSDGTGLRNGTYDLYSWARTTALEWTNYGSSNSSSLYMSRGTGYLYANQEDTEITFAGSIYGSGSSYSAYVSYTAPTAGTTDFSDWNLLGNPFVCNAYLVDAATNGNALAFYKMNADGNGFEATTGTAIAPMEGVFYQATEAGSVYFTREMSATSTQPGTLNISLAQVVATRGAKGSTDNAIIRFGEGNTLGKFSFNENSAKVYIPQNGKDYAVVNAGNVGEMPVNFKANENGSYTLSFSNSEVTFSYLHLIDNMTGADVDLLATPSYTFDARYTDYASRFRLVFATGSSANGENFGFVNASGNLSIFGIEGTATLQVIDVTGRILSSETFSGSYERKLNAAPGVYMLRLINGNDVKVQKIVVK